jgi:5'-3' exonuclease
MTADKLLLLDTPSLYFRAFYGIPESVTAPDGTPVNAIRGLLDFIARLVRDFRPTRVVAAMDADWRPAWRVAALPSYKAHRVGLGGGDQTPDALAVQVPVIEQVLDALGLARVGVNDYEADDVIGTLSTTAGCPVDVVTGDRDLFQLVRDDQPVRVVYTARGVGKAEAWDEAAVTAKYGIPGRGYAELAILRGDPSDGLPGVAGVGEKTAAKLITTYGSLAALRVALDGGDPALKGAQRARLEAGAAYLDVAPRVVEVVRDATLPEVDLALPSAVADPTLMSRLAVEHGLTSSFDRVVTALRIG